MSTVYAVERWRDIKVEMMPLLVRHWYEVALNHEDVPLDIDEGKYDEMDAKWMLQIVTVRRDRVLIGYHVAIIMSHLHYKSTLHGITDVYFIAPEYRHGITAMRMFQVVETKLAACGVKKMVTGVKLHLDQGPLFERLGYRAVERQYSKIIGGSL